MKKEFVNHKYEILNDIIIKIISKKKTIELELSKSYNNILNSNNREGIDYINDSLNRYAKILNNMNNLFRNEYIDYKNKYNEFDNQKKILIENMSKINGDLLTFKKFSESHDWINTIYTDLISKKILLTLYLTIQIIISIISMIISIIIIISFIILLILIIII